MKIAIASDHAGFEYKAVLRLFIQSLGHEVKDFGPASADSVDYPDFAHPLAISIEQGEFELGVLICGSGNGVCMTANKHQHIRAALCWTEELALLARQHNNANVICLPARFIDLETAKALVAAFLKAEFEGGRHERRVGKIACQ